MILLILIGGATVTTPTPVPPVPITDVYAPTDTLTGSAGGK